MYGERMKVACSYLNGGFSGFCRTLVEVYNWPHHDHTDLTEYIKSSLPTGSEFNVS